MTGDRPAPLVPAEGKRKRKPDTWMPLDIGDYLADTMQFTTEQHGAYLLMLMHYWRTGPLPDNDAQLAAIAKLSPAKWRALRPLLGALPYFNIRDGRWHQKRADEEMEKARELTGNRSTAGKAGAEARWGQNDSNRDGKQDGKRIATPLANPSQTDGPLPSPSQEKKEPVASQPPAGAGAGATDLLNGAGGEDHARRPIDLNAEVWSTGLRYLKSAAKLDEKRARPLLGKWRQRYGNAAVLDVLAVAESEAPSEPVAFIEKTLEARYGQGRGRAAGGDRADPRTTAAARFLARGDG